MPATDGSDNPGEREHLALVRSLTRELECARRALVQNDLPRFKAHVAEQEAICVRMGGAQGQPDLPSYRQAGREIRQAYASLAHEKRVFAAFIRRAKRTSDLLSALYRCRDGYGQHAGAIAKLETWSCEG